MCIKSDRHLAVSADKSIRTDVNVNNNPPVGDAISRCSIFSLISFSHVKVQVKKSRVSGADFCESFSLLSGLFLPT